MMPTEGPNATYNFPVILHGGPKDGTIMSLDYLTNNSGRLMVPIKTGTYVRQRKHAGEPHTCEYREWYEWHWVE